MPKTADKTLRERRKARGGKTFVATSGIAKGTTVDELLRMRKAGQRRQAAINRAIAQKQLKKVEQRQQPKVVKMAKGTTIGRKRKAKK